MSVHVSSWAWRVKLPTLASKLVLLKLADASNDDGMSYPSRRTMMAQTGLSERSVKVALRYLRDAGLITIEQRQAANGRSTSNIYWLHQGEGVLATPYQRVRSDPLEGVPVDPPEGVRSDPLTTLNRKDEPSEGTESRETEVSPVWASYQQHHPAAKLTHDRRQLIQRRLKDYPAATLIAAIEGNHESEWHKGDNPMGKRYHDLGLILRNADHIESFAELHQEPKGGKRYVDLQEALRNAQAAGFSA